jgi:DNA-binding Lrp family transcriptional regulator
MIGKGLTARSVQILRVLFERGNRETVYNTEKTQSEIAEQFKITRQALNVHLKKLRNMGYVKTGRGFISVTEEGLKALGIYRNPAIVTVRVSPQKRSEAYEKIKVLPAIQILRVTGDVDVVIMSDQGKIDETLKRISKIDGVEETRSYVCIEILK